MIPSKYSNGVDWLMFSIERPSLIEEDEIFEEKWQVHFTFLASNWECLYGNGCPGLFGTHENTYKDDIGCCRHGFWFSDPDDMDRIQSRVDQLTGEDWDIERMAKFKHDWKVVFSIDRDEEDINGRSRVSDGACVFSNRNTGSVGRTGKMGCAFHHLGERIGQPDHVDTFPAVCWQLPLRMQTEGQINYVYPWTLDEWGGQDEDGTYDSFACWWCVDSNEAYSGSRRVYQGMEHELRELMGDQAYDRMVELLEERLARYEPSPMSGQTLNDGRPLLPLLVGNRQPQNRPSMTGTPQVIQKMKEQSHVGTDTQG